jgi:hypothetical protein
MKYTLLIYLDAARFYGLSRDEQNRIHQACGAWHDEIVRHGHAVTAIGLQPEATARTIRRKGDQILVTDGPFAETREVLGGLESIRCDSYEQALAYAESFPGLEAGGAVEIRPEVPDGKCEA